MTIHPPRLGGGPYQAVLAVLFALLLAGCGGGEDPAISDRLHLKYWEKWTGFELQARQKVVDLFNQSQDKIFVELFSISQIERKLTVAIAGGNPPDIAGLFSEFTPVFAEQNAILPLDGYMQRHGISAGDFLDNYMNKCVYDGFTWALPTCGNVLAYHYNKDLFRHAGLDPENPPKTMDELVAIEEQLNLVSPERIRQVAFLPSEPDWWPYVWPIFFGGKYYDGEGKLLLTSPEVVRAYEWVAGYSERLGVRRVQAFRGGFGKLFATPQNPFLAGTVASVLQGNWMINFVEKYNPLLDFGVAPMPTDSPEYYGASLVEGDIIFIPKGARYPDESFEFIKFITNQQCSEMFTSDMRAISPRRERSPGYYRFHPNPNIEMFDQMARSPLAWHTPNIPVWYEMLDEMKAVFDKVWLHQMTAREALSEAQARLQGRLDQDRERWDKVGDVRRKEWNRFIEATREGKLPE
jgi:ABC-type glycerol-3-phosphate transport system substrate-binding protein